MTDEPAQIGLVQAIDGDQQHVPDGTVAVPDGTVAVPIAIVVAGAVTVVVAAGMGGTRRNGYRDRRHRGNRGPGEP